MAKSHFRQEQYASSHFVESAGTILFDFRHTNTTTHALLNHHTSDSPLAFQNPASTPSEPNVILVHHTHHQSQILLPKGRRNTSEPRHAAALRETREETGLKCHLLPITLHSRATSTDPSRDKTNSNGSVVNEVRTFQGSVTNPFMVTVRHAERGRERSGGANKRPSGAHVKLIWWFVAVVDDVQDGEVVTLDPGCEVVSVRASEAVEKCTYRDDGDVVEKAIEIVQETLGCRWMGKRE